MYAEIVWRLFFIIGFGFLLGLAKFVWFRGEGWMDVILPLMLIGFVVLIEFIESPGERRDRLKREASWRENEEQHKALENAQNEAKTDGRGLPWAG